MSDARRSELIREHGYVVGLAMYNIETDPRTCDHLAIDHGCVQCKAWRAEGLPRAHARAGGLSRGDAWAWASIMTPPTADELAQSIYDRHSAGCCLHIVLDDGNVEDGHVSFCLDEARKRDCRECEQLATMMLAMTPRDRARVAGGKALFDCPKCGCEGLDMVGIGFNPEHLRREGSCFQFTETTYECVHEPDLCGGDPTPSTLREQRVPDPEPERGAAFLERLRRLAGPS